MRGRLDKILYETTLNLVKVSIFYVPESFVDLLKIQKTEGIMADVNRLVLIDKGGYSLNPDETKAGMFILSKKRILDENILLLYDFKENNSKGGLEYVVEKYGELVKSFLYLSEWFINNVQEDVSDLTSDQKTALKLQYQFLLKHKHEFEDKFCKIAHAFSVSEASTKTALGNIKPIVANLSKRFVKKATNHGLDRREYIKRLKEDTKAKAEDYLLETVFNMKL